MPEIIDIIETQEKAPTLLPWQWLAIVLVSLILVTASILIFKQKKRSHMKIDNLKQALSALKKVEHSSQSENKDSNWLTIELSFITRAYLQGQFSNRSIFQTHQEFIHDHEDLEKLPVPAREKLAVYLSSLADHKYAPNPHLPEEKNKLIQITESLLRGIDSTIPKNL